MSLMLPAPPTHTPAPGESLHTSISCNGHISSGEQVQRDPPRTWGDLNGSDGSHRGRLKVLEGEQTGHPESTLQT